MIVTPQPAPPMGTAVAKTTPATLGDSLAAGAGLPFAQLLGIVPEGAMAQLEPEKPTDTAEAQIASGEEPIDDTQDSAIPPGMTLQTLAAPRPGQLPELTMSTVQAFSGEAPSAQGDEPAQETTALAEPALAPQGVSGAKSAPLLGTPAIDAPPPGGQAVVTPAVRAPSPYEPAELVTRTVAAPTAVAAPTPAARPAEGVPTLSGVAEPLATTQLRTSDVSGFGKAAAPTEATVPVRAMLQPNQAERAPSTGHAEAVTQSQSVNSASTLPIDAAAVTVAKASLPGQEAPQLGTRAVVLAPASKADPEVPATAPVITSQQQLRTEASHTTVTEVATPQAEPLAPSSGQAPVTGIAPTMSVPVDSMQAPALSASPAPRSEVATAMPSTMVGQLQEMQRAGQPQRRIVIRLDPPELGTVRLELTKVGDDVLVAARAETAEAARAILRQQPEIRTAVEALGLSLTGFDVQTPNEQEARHRFGQGDRSRSGLTEPEADTAGSEDERVQDEHNEGAIFL